MKTLRFALQIVLGIALPLAAQLWDRRRLSPEQREACWNGATWGAALYAFGPFSMLGWCWVTRGTWRGRSGWSRGRAARALVALGLGLVAAAVLGGALVAADYALGLALEGAW